MSTRTDWGWFKADGTPIAVGDTWHKWECPKYKWVPDGYAHYITGEWIESEPRKMFECKMTTTINAKREECKLCGNVFVYP
jgi:hypothetical protein